MLEALKSVSHSGVCPKINRAGLLLGLPWHQKECDAVATVSVNITHAGLSPKHLCLRFSQMHILNQFYSCCISNGFLSSETECLHPHPLHFNMFSFIISVNYENIVVV